MITGPVAAGVPAAWVASDEFYGDNDALRVGVAALGYSTFAGKSRPNWLGVQTMRSTVPAVASLSLLALLAAACGTSANSGGGAVSQAPTAAVSTPTPGVVPPTPADMSEGSPNNGGLPYLAGNQGCFFTPGEMATILGHGVSAAQVHANYGPTQRQYPDDHICHFGAVAVPNTGKYLYFGIEEVRCGQDGRTQYLAAGPKYTTRAPRTVHNVRITRKDPAHPKAALIAYVWVNGCSVSALPAFNAKTGDFAGDLNAEMAAVAHALDAAVGRAA
jgi:hypothetical protein